MKLKVAVVNTVKNRGGAARAATAHARGMLRYSNAVDIKMFHAENNEHDSLFVGINNPFARAVNIVLARLFGSRAVFDFGFTKLLKSLISNYSILHLHNVHGYYLNYPELLKYWANRPVVWTWHDMWGATGRCAFSIKCDLWEYGCKKCGHPDYYPAAWIDNASREFQIKESIYQTTLSNVLIVTPSSWLRDIAIKRGFRQDRVVTIPNSINVDRFRVMDKKAACERTGLNPGKKYLLFIAADCNDIRKGYNDFSEVVRINGLQGIAVGRRPKNEKKGILHIGEVSGDEELCKYYNAAEAMVIPSADDNYPNTSLEAMACGTPVFGYKTGGVPSQMPGWWDGIVGAGDYEGLSKKINAFMDTGGKSDNLTKRFRDYAVQTWHPKYIAKQYWEVYQRLMVEYENRRKVTSKGSQ